MKTTTVGDPNRINWSLFVKAGMKVMTT